MQQNQVKDCNFHMISSSFNLDSVFLAACGTASPVKPPSRLYAQVVRTYSRSIAQEKSGCPLPGPGLFLPRLHPGGTLCPIGPFTISKAEMLHPEFGWANNGYTKSGTPLFPSFYHGETLTIATTGITVFFLKKKFWFSLYFYDFIVLSIGCMLP